LSPNSWNDLLYYTLLGTTKKNIAPQTSATRSISNWLMVYICGVKNVHYRLLFHISRHEGEREVSLQCAARTADDSCNQVCRSNTFIFWSDDGAVRPFSCCHSSRRLRADLWPTDSTWTYPIDYKIWGVAACVRDSRR